MNKTSTHFEWLPGLRMIKSGMPMSRTTPICVRKNSFQVQICRCLRGNSEAPFWAVARRGFEKGSYLLAWAHLSARGLHALPGHWPPSFLRGACPILSSTWADPSPKLTRHFHTKEHKCCIIWISEEATPILTGVLPAVRMSSLSGTCWGGSTTFGGLESLFV